MYCTVYAASGILYNVHYIHCLISQDIKENIKNKQSRFEEPRCYELLARNLEKRRQNENT
jgi:hypothetical protein